MTVVSVKTGADRDALRIGLSDGSLFFVRPCYLPDTLVSVLSPGSEVSDAEASALRRANYIFRAERAALRLIARSEQTSAALQRKLEQRGYDRDVGALVMERLRRLEFVDDRRFAQRWLASRLSLSGDAPRSLTAALVRRGVSVSTAAEAVRLTVTPKMEGLLIRRCLDKRFKNADLPSKDQVRLVLRKRGFTSQSIRNYLEEAF